MLKDDVNSSSSTSNKQHEEQICHQLTDDGDNDNDYRCQSHQDDEVQQQQQEKPRRKIRVLVISMGGERKEIIKQMFQSNNQLINEFDTPVFIDGIPSRSLRNRSTFFYYANMAGLLPINEYIALSTAQTNPFYNEYPERLYECLVNIPINNNNNNRRGTEYDLQMHYSIELWKKAKTINRGRAVLACTLAHLIALRKLTTENFDILLEDNVRIPITVCAQRIWNTIDSIQEWEKQQQQQQQSGINNDSISSSPTKCHVRYYGWLGSVPNLRWIYESHIQRKQFQRKQQLEKNTTSSHIGMSTIVEFPLTQDVENDLQEKEINSTINIASSNKTTTTSSSCTHENNNNNNNTTTTNNNNNSSTDERRPGGNTVWGAYAYWISKDAYETIMTTLQNDVGSLLWKSKKMKHYLVKPIDKIIPRTIIAQLGQTTVQLSTNPAFFRAPMLTSKIHTQWDPEFCKSTQVQLQKTGLTWNCLSLTKNEQEVVQYYDEHGQWIPHMEIKTLANKLDSIAIQ